MSRPRYNRAKGLDPPLRGAAVIPPMPAPTFDGSFPHKWTAEILPQRPMILPSRHYVYPGAVEEVERGALEVLIRPEGASEPFLATCALGFRDPAAPTGIWAMPDPDWLCAVSGGYAYLVDVTAPDRSEERRVGKECVP